MSHIDDVARAAGVSPSTVSRALRGLPHVSAATRELVERYASELGYVPSASASGLASGRNLALSVVVPSVESWFYASVLEGVDAELRAADYDLVLFNLGGGHEERETVFHRSLLRKRGDALLALCIDFTPEERDELRAVELPVVIVGGPVKGLRYVGIDEVDVARRATEHLLALGHRDIVHLTGGDEARRELNPRVPEDRLLGYQEALRAAGIRPTPSRVLPGTFSTAESRRVVDALLDGPGPVPTAIFAASDEMAMGAILSIMSHGLSIPDDISVIGIDDHVLAASFGLTTMAQHPFEQGAAGARILLDELAGRPVRKGSLKLPVELVERGSTAPPRRVP